MKSLRTFVRSDVFGGFLLCMAGLLAIILSNSPGQQLYEGLINTRISIDVLGVLVEKPLVLWINDGLMAIFFLLVGLEIKREICRGLLHDKKRLILPVVGALGGIIVPALIYAAINYDNPVALRGWAIPAATDIAFALGVLSLLGNRVPVALKVFLTALAILDDMGAVLIIAFFYTAKLSLIALFAAGFFIVVLVIMNQIGIKRISAYLSVGFLLWFSLLESGVHATLSGVILALTIPISGSMDSLKAAAESELDDLLTSPLIKLEHRLFPYVTFIVLPLFAFANSGFSFAGLTLSSIMAPVPLGIALGLFFGKQIGIFVSCWITVRFGYGELPEEINWIQFYGLAVLCGIGFTMSLFIGTLAFEQQSIEYARLLRLGILFGTVPSALLGLFLLRFFSENKES